jgi:hypothetical protein
VGWSDLPSDVLALRFANGGGTNIPESIGALPMPRRIMLSIFATAISALTASAADLPVQSRLGAIFAEPVEVRAYTYRAEAKRKRAPIIHFNLLPVLPWARGGYYYGSPWSYYYPGPYYGGPYAWYGDRLPYVCGLYGYCN